MPDYDDNGGKVIIIAILLNSTSQTDTRISLQIEGEKLISLLEGCLS